MIRLELWVEGPTDASTRSPSAPADEPSVPAGGALIPLVRKALGADAPAEDEIAARRLYGRLRDVTSLPGRERGTLTKKGKKVIAAIDQARSRAPGLSIVAVWDRDGEDEPLRDRDAINDLLRKRGSVGACAGICVEEVEAWLLADANAFKLCFGRGPQRGLPGEPEADPAPKATLDALLPKQEDGSYAELYRQLAEHVDLEVLTRRCPRGFGELRDALDELVRPALDEHP